MAQPTDNYILSRDASEAERLDLQHRCILSCQGYYLHPSISTGSSPRIAELCTGTAIWIREVASAYPTAELHGFDISSTMFPDQSTLPQNLRLHNADIKKPFDDQWVGHFDIVHIRLIQAAMQIAEWGPVLKNITTLLKPGGWLQWYEDDRAVAVRHALRPVAPLRAQQGTAAEGAAQWRPTQSPLIARFNRFIIPDDRGQAMNYGYMNLDTLMMDPEYGNMTDVDCDGFVIDRKDDDGKLRKDWMVMGISAVWNMIKVRPDLGAEIDMDREAWTDHALKEIEAGAHYVSRAAVFVGRKRF